MSRDRAAPAARWQAIRYRRLQVVTLVALAALITACAALTPLYHRAMQQALTRLTVDAAAPAETAIEIRTASRFTSGVENVGYTVAPHERLAALLPAHARGWFLPPVADASVTVLRTDPGGTPSVGELLWRDGACEHLTWAAGGCPADPGEIAISAADAANFGLAVGGTLAVRERTAVEPERPPEPVPLRVTGVYRQPADAWWSGRVLEGVSGFPDSRPPRNPQHDTWLTSGPTFLGPGAAWLDQAHGVTFGLDRPAVGVDQVVATGPVVAATAAAVTLRVDEVGNPVNDPGTVVGTVSSGLPAIAAGIEEGRRQALVTVPLLMIQIGLLSFFVLTLVLGTAVEQRRPEVALARLRGAGRRDARRTVAAEVVPVVLAGVPFGVAAALGLATLARRTVMRDAAPFELPAGFWLAIGGAVVALAALAWVAAARGTRDGIAELLRGVPARRTGWSLGVADAVVVAAALTAVLAFATGGLTGPLALAVPGLLALAAGLLLAHVVLPAAARLGRALLARGRYAAAAAVLALARRPSTRRVVAVLTVATSLLVFSAVATQVGARNRELTALRENGAPAVADVTGSDVARVQAALAAVPGGHATPVVRTVPAAAGGVRRTTLAVVPAEFRRVAAFPDADAAALPWDRLAAVTGPRLEVTGRSVSLVVTPRGLTVTPARVFLQLDLLTPAGDRVAVDLGAVPTDGPRTLAAAVPCERGCTVAGLGLRSTPGQRYSGELEIGGTGGPDALPGTAAAWRAFAEDEDRIEPLGDAPGALTLGLANDGSGPRAMTAAWLPELVPALAAGGAAGAADARAGLLGTGLDGADRPLAVVGALPRVPAVGGAAALADLTTMRHWGDRVAPPARIQVWLDTEDPAALARVRAALRADGIEIGAVRTVTGVRRGYETSVPSWGLQLGALAAVAGLLIAALVVVLLVAGGWRQRSRDLACLAMAGVPRRGLHVVAAGELLPVVVVSVLAGTLCGLLGARLALPTVPLFAAPDEYRQLDLSVPWLAALAVVAVAAAVLVTVALLCARLVLRRARPARVREVL